MANINDIVMTAQLQEKLQSAKSLEDVVKICAEEGIEVTAGELAAAIAEPSADASGELNEDALDAVSGGVSLSGLLKWLRTVAGHGTVPGGNGKFKAI